MPLTGALLLGGAAPVWAQGASGQPTASVATAPAAAEAGTDPATTPMAFDWFGWTWCVGQPAGVTCDHHLPATALTSAGDRQASAPAAQPIRRWLDQLKEVFSRQGSEPAAPGQADRSG